MTGILVVPAGTAAAPSFKFTGSTNTGISAATSNTLSFDTNGVSQMTVSTTAITAILPLIISNLFCQQSYQSASFTSPGSVTVSATTSILLLKPSAGSASVTITFPSSPTNGQILDIVNATTNSITSITNTSSKTIVNAVTALSPSGTGGASVSYLYDSTDSVWYRIGLG
jgi:hypothetical protein